MASFLKTASKNVVDVRGFLRDSAGGNSIKYSAEKGAKHLVYIPYVNEEVTDEDGNTKIVKSLVAIGGDVHDWTSPDGKYNSTVCLKDVIRKSEDGDILINDGSCPFCDRVSDAWDIFNYRKQLEEETCKLTGDDREKHLEKANRTFADERKAKAARPYLYILVVKYRLGEGNAPIVDSNGLPEYDLKVMKLSRSRVEKIQQQIANAGSEMVGSELIFEYPATDNKMLQVSQSTTAPVFPNNQLVTKFPALREKIDKDVAKFQWDGIEKAFREWNGMSIQEATKITTELFEKWDEYNAQLLANPNGNVKYLEYVTDTPVTNPSLSQTTPVIPAATPVVPVVTGNVEPEAPKPPSVNNVFEGSEIKMPTIEI